MSKSKELITKQHPISAGDILGMVAGLAAAAMHIYTIDPTSKLSKMLATEAIPALRQIILPIAEEANQLAAAFCCWTKPTKKQSSLACPMQYHRLSNNHRSKSCATS